MKHFKLSILLFAVCFTCGCGAPEGKQSLNTEMPLVAAAQEAVNAVKTKATAGQETTPKEEEPLQEEIEIQKSSKRISNRLANAVFAYIKEQISASNEGFGRCENFRFVISGERKRKDGRIWEKLWIYYDLIPVRKPEESPFIIGMKEARDELTDKEQIVCADREIEGWIKGLEYDYEQQKEEPDMWNQMWLAYEPDGEDYTVYCDTTDYSDRQSPRYKQVTLEEYIKQHTEDYDLRKKEGREYIAEAVARLGQTR